MTLRFPNSAIDTMNIPDSDLRWEYLRSKSPGGQHQQKSSTCVRVTHIPTGISAQADGRHQHKNKKMALAELKAKLIAISEQRQAAAKKARRDEAIHDKTTIRTYNYPRSTVKDHRSGKSANIHSFLNGKVDLSSFSRKDSDDA